ncbi:hypothetical protein E1B28_002241 [Marasmius oreades]|uniref:Uncharacterized protein n=1 Tax=Marasmius oreades TaxID=181124 RepID=A0A9P7RMM8_9AGAR|nr:uncharacterized protein E1B28_002241 [Marasmius oreades]KAG7086277.1 hypothetical protein E1B28_002241 [Marasmius oreades]
MSSHYLHEKRVPRHRVAGIRDSSSPETNVVSKSPLEMALSERQKLFTRLSEDPELSQHKIYRFCAPIIVFLALVLSATLISRKWSAVDLVQNESTLVKMLLAVVSVVLGSLLTLRGLIWVIGRGVRMFLQVDLNASSRSLQAEIMTGMFGMEVSDLEFACYQPSSCIFHGSNSKQTSIYAYVYGVMVQPLLLMALDHIKTSFQLSQNVYLIDTSRRPYQNVEI